MGANLNQLNQNTSLVGDLKRRQMNAPTRPGATSSFGDLLRRMGGSNPNAGNRPGF